MRRSTRIAGLVAVMCLIHPPPAIAQRAGEPTLYNKIGFAGQAYTLTGPRKDITLAWSVPGGRALRPFLSVPAPRQDQPRVV